MSEDTHAEPVGDEKTALHNPEEEKEVDGKIPLDAELDSSKVKFINGGASGDVHVDFPLDDSEQAFCGLTKEQLQKYADDPYWVKVRWVLLILFWLAWFAMLAAAIVIIIVAPKCPPRPNLDWWQTSAFYSVYPRSFQDTNNDGIGDLKGIENHVDYIHDLNTTAVFINSIYESPMKDLGYDISDFKAIDSDYGTMEDFDNMRAHFHKKGMKLILDFVPNHSSNQHKWFLKSKEGKNNEYSDYYIWHDGKPGASGNPEPPNNWLSIYGGSAWTFDTTRQQFYYHSHHSEMPDLNLRNPEVLRELEEILQFWMDKGVDGFRVDSAMYLFESVNVTQNEPSSGKANAGEYDSLKHTHTVFQPESYEIITRWREFLDAASDFTGVYKYMTVDAYGVNQSMGFYEHNGKKGADTVLNHVLIDVEEGCSGTCVETTVHKWLNNMPSDKWGSWMIGNHDKSRASERMGTDGDHYVNALNMLYLLLPGTSYTYYGEEIGMVDGDQQVNDARDHARTPMQWNTEENAGFSEATPWLPVNDDYTARNVKIQLAHGAGVSQLEVFRELTLLRKEPSFQWGSYEDGQVAGDDIYAYIRQAEGFDGYLVAINFGPDTSIGDFHAARPDIVPSMGEIVATTANFGDPHRFEEFKVGTEVYLDNIILQPGEGVVFKWDASFVPA